jgi:hypothetical protein
MKLIEDATEIDSTRAVSDTARGSKKRSDGTIKRLFGDAGKALTRGAPGPQSKPARRRREDTGKSAFTITARKMIGRAAALPHDCAAVGFLWDTLDWLNLWHGNDAAGSGEFEAKPGSSIAPRL